MTVAAMTWAFKQQMPPAPKVVLLSLADQADDETGRVCYGRTDLDHLAGKASVSKRSLYRYIGALVRNGYMLRESGAKKRERNKYWLQLDRAPTPLETWQWFESEPDFEECAEEDSANLAPSESPLESDADPGVSAEQGCHGDTLPVPLVAHKESTDNQSTKTPEIANPPVVTESGFSKRKQKAERIATAKQREAAKPAQYFVIEGSEPYRYWETEMRRRTGNPGWHLVVDRATVDGKIRRGWYFPSLYPPAKPKAPPGEAELSDEDARALMG